MEAGDRGEGDGRWSSGAVEVEVEAGGARGRTDTMASKTAEMGPPPPPPADGPCR